LSYASLTAGLGAYRGGACIAGAFIVAIIAGGVTFMIGLIALTMPITIGPRRNHATYGVPASIADYRAPLGLRQVYISTKRWRVAFAVIGAIAIGGTAWARKALFAPTDEGRRSAGGPLPHRLAGATGLG